MRPSQLSALSALSLSALLVLSGCASKSTVDPTAGWSPNRIHTEAKDEARSANYERAIELYERLEGRAAGTPLAQQAELEKAYTQYKGGERASAIATLNRFIQLHPASPAVDYALYLKGVVNFNDDLGMLSFISRQDLSERDQRAAKASFEAFQELVTRFPESRYTPDAQARMRYIINALAQYEVHVARYYHSRGAHVAAINRAQAALTEFRDAPALEEALLILVKSYDALAMTQLRDDTQRILEATYPNSNATNLDSKKIESPWWKLW